ncbi:MAG: S-adenosylmethionine decarboxylase proenzyme [Lentisphaerae bacterium GWF2_45_14]|nr:MAG: S-adenosylmethionine decarboxylase proenzyme [Lentisphaerae bacterium GWF2_45_14]
MTKALDYGGKKCAASAQHKHHHEARFALGRHMTIEYYDCDHLVLNDPKKVEEIFINAAKESGATVLSSSFHSFEPQGVSGMVIIAESHFSVHAWPEHDYAAVDIFTCGDLISFNVAVESLKRGLGAEEAIVSADMNRGIVSNNGIEKLVPVVEDRSHIYTLSWKKKFELSNAWGLLSSVDIYNCDESIITNADKVREFVLALCEKINLKRFGDCVVVDFGENEQIAGFSMTQLIETSLVSGHFANATKAAYLDIFSCKFYEPREVAEFAIEFFKGSHYKMQVALRK